MWRKNRNVSLGWNSMREHRAWMITGSMLPLKVQRMITENQVMLAKSKDPRLRELDRVLDKLGLAFTQALHKQMERIEFEFGKDT